MVAGEVPGRATSTTIISYYGGENRAGPTRQRGSAALGSGWEEGT